MRLCGCGSLYSRDAVRLTCSSALRVEVMMKSAAGIQRQLVRWSEAHALVVLVGHGAGFRRRVAVAPDRARDAVIRDTRVALPRRLAASGTLRRSQRAHERENSGRAGAAVDRRRAGCARSRGRGADTLRARRRGRLARPAAWARLRFRGVSGQGSGCVLHARHVSAALSQRASRRLDRRAGTAALRVRRLPHARKTARAQGTTDRTRPLDLLRNDIGPDRRVHAFPPVV